MLQERRHFQRVELDSPLIVLLDESKYSLFDLCEEGLAVGGLTARRRGEVIRFGFDLPERSGYVQGKAEIVWINGPGHRAGLHVLDLVPPSREQLIEWMSARTCTTSLVGIEKESIRPTVTQAPEALINPIFQHSGDHIESRSEFSLFPTIVVALVLLLLSSGLGLLVYHSRRTRNNLQARDSTNAEKSPELPFEDAPASAKSSSEIIPFPTLPARLDLPGFVLQVGAMRQEANADALAQDLQEKKFPAFVYKSGTDSFYRVAVGPYSDQDSSARVKPDLEKNGFKPFLRRWVPE